MLPSGSERRHQYDAMTSSQVEDSSNLFGFDFQLPLDICRSVRTMEAPEHRFLFFSVRSDVGLFTNLL